MKAAIGAPGRAGFNPPWSAEADPTANQNIPTGTHTSLHIGSDVTHVTRADSDQPDDTLVLGIGYERTATDFFKHLPPTPLELENAIMAVEDEVIRAGKWLAQGTTLWTHDVGIREMAQLTGVADSARMVLTVDAVERQFDFLAAWVQGRPGSSAGIPLDSGFAARPRVHAPPAVCLDHHRGGPDAGLTRFSRLHFSNPCGEPCTAVVQRFC